VKRFSSIRLEQYGVATQAQYRCQIENHLLPAFGDLKLCELDKPAVEQFLTTKAETLGWWARNNLRSILSAIFKTAKDWRLWDGENPTLGVRIGKKKFAREKRLLSIEQLRVLLGALPDRLKFIVLIQFGLGLRISETLGLKWKDIDFERHMVSVKRDGIGGISAKRIRPRRRPRMRSFPSALRCLLSLLDGIRVRQQTINSFSSETTA
jgi:integrase